MTFSEIQWNATHDELQLNLHRHAYGLHAPIRVKMERAFVSQRHRLPALPQSNLGLSILTGDDINIEFEDFLGGNVKIRKKKKRKRETYENYYETTCILSWNMQTFTNNLIYIFLFCFFTAALYLGPSSSTDLIDVHAAMEKQIFGKPL